ncbi:hypothetical protein DFS34DRAFT_624104 [Phlyctochytrium arcticum]|nr:hypothetical protein DFS34DRAFT_624104 [Phlyctochytrium arcticum]
MAGAGGVGRVLKKLTKSVEDGNYYEAHQMYHSVCQRYVKQNKIDDALELLQSGAKNMIKHNQLGSAGDLSQRMLVLFESEKLAVTDQTRGRILDIFAVYPLDTEQCDNFVRMCIKWSSKHGKFPTGDPLMHHAFGARYYKAKEYYDAEDHFVYGTIDSAKAIGHMTWEWANQGYFEDKGYFIARSVLQYLAQKKLHHAVTAYETFVKDAGTQDPSLLGTSLSSSLPQNIQTPALSSPHLSTSPFLNLVQFVLLAVQRDAAAQFTSIRTQYRQVIAFDSYLMDLVEKVARTWFALGPKRVANPLEDMMKNLFAAPPQSRPTIQSAADMDMD